MFALHEKKNIRSVTKLVVNEKEEVKRNDKTDLASSHRRTLRFHPTCATSQSTLPARFRPGCAAEPRTQVSKHSVKERCQEDSVSQNHPMYEVNDSSELWLNEHSGSGGIHRSV